MVQEDGSWCNGVSLEGEVATLIECISPYWRDTIVDRKGSRNRIEGIRPTSNEEAAFLAPQTGAFLSEVKSNQVSKPSPGDVLLAAGFMPVFEEEQVGYQQMAVPFTVIEANEKEITAAMGVERAGDFVFFQQMRGMGLYKIDGEEVELAGLLTDVVAKGEAPEEISKYLLQQGFPPPSFDFLARFVTVE